MNPEPNTTQHVEPASGSAVVPMWLIVFTALLLWAGGVYFDATGGWFNQSVYAPYRDLAELEQYQLPASGSPWLSKGKQIFELNCALCHNSDGMGKPNQAPPFVKSEWVLGSPERLIRIPQAGLNGPIEVAGQSYTFAAGMAPMGAPLSDQDLADVLSYMRNSWGNKAEPITGEQVKAVRSKIAGHPQQFTVEELKSIQ